MSTLTLDLSPATLDIKFQKGATLNPVFFYLTSEYDTIDLGYYTARMQVKLAYEEDAPLTDWDLTTENGGLSIVQGDAELPNGTIVTDAWGVQVNVSAEVTGDVKWRRALYDLELLIGTQVIPMLRGTLVAVPEVTLA